MGKVAVVVILAIAFATGCAQKTETTEMPVDVQETVTEEVVETPVEATVVTQEGQVEEFPMVEEQVTVQETATITYVKPDIKKIQQALASAGFYNGKIDGVLGPMTAQAIKDFQLKNGLVVDGKVGPKTWALLEPYLSQLQAPEETPAQ